MVKNEENLTFYNYKQPLEEEEESLSLCFCYNPNHTLESLLIPGETFNGILLNCDNWMNINLKEVICTAPDGSRFWKIAEIHIRGNTIKYLRIPDSIIDKVKQEQAARKNENRDYKSGGGGRGGKRGGRGDNNRGGRDRKGGDKKTESANK